MDSLYLPGLLSASVVPDSLQPWSPPGSSVPRDSQAGILGWVALPSHRGIFPRPRGSNLRLSCLPLAGRLFTMKHTGSPHFNLIISLKQHLHIQAHSETVGTREQRERGHSGHDKLVGKETHRTFLLL